MAAAMHDTRIAVFAHLDRDDIDAAGGAAARRLDDGVGQIFANKRRAAMGEIAYCKRRELRASFDFGRPGCFVINAPSGVKSCAYALPRSAAVSSAYADRAMSCWISM